MISKEEFSYKLKDEYNKLLKLSEHDLLELFGISKYNQFSNYSSMYITHGGDIINIGDFYGTQHVNKVMHTAIFKEYLLKQIGIENYYLDSDYNELLIRTCFGIQDVLMDKFNWIKINSGTYTCNVNPYLVIGKNPTDYQWITLYDLIWHLKECKYNKLKIYVPKYSYDYDLDDPDRIITQLKRYFRFGILYQ